MTKILWINPLGTQEFDAPVSEALAHESDAQIDIASLSQGPVNLDPNSSATVMGHETLRVIRWAEQEGYDAAVIGCFYDPYLRAAREITNRLVVVAPAESSLRIASTLGDSYSILVGSRKNIPEMHENVVRYGHENKLASFRTLDISVNDYQSVSYTHLDVYKRQQIAGVRKIIRARVLDVAGLSRPSPPGQPDRPSSVVLIDEDHGHIVQLEIQNELLMVLVDGVIESVMPDIITMLNPEDASVAGFEDLWVCLLYTSRCV